MACLGNANKPLLVEEAKAAYLTRVLQNIALNVEYIAYMDNYETFMRSGKGHNYSFVNQTDLREIINRYTEQLHPAITTFFLPHKEDVGAEPCCLLSNRQHRPTIDELTAIIFWEFIVSLYASKNALAGLPIALDTASPYTA